MRKEKSWLALFLAGIMTVSCAFPASAASETVEISESVAAFVDVETGEVTEEPEGVSADNAAAEKQAGAEVSKTEQVISPQRKYLNFDTDWLYSSVDYSNGYVVGLDDSGFEAVSVPHANKIIEKHKGEEDFQEQIESYRFVSWYRRHFTLPNDYEGSQIRVEFEGVATVADVYINGQYLSTHKGAYTGFTVDITDYVYTDGRDNVLAVRVDSTRQTEIPPEGGNVDYCVFGGIVRDVSMIVTDPVYVERTFVTTPDLTDTQTHVNTQVDITNVYDEEKNYTVETVVKDMEGNTVITASKDAVIGAATQTTVDVQTDLITNPHLWNIDDPYLYTLVTNIKDGDKVIDSYDTRFGMRYFEFKTGPDDGSLYLNGEKVVVVGINRHEQWPWIGRAVPDKLQARDADMIKESGLNAVRCSHYPQDPAFMDRCDEIGLLVFTEAPGWQHIGDTEWKANFKTNLQELILRDRNHPSIISWSVTPNESQYNASFNKECQELAKELDPTRPTHGVRWEFYYEDNADDEVIPDILTVNYRYPDTPFHIPYLVTEYMNECWFDGDGVPGVSDAGSMHYIDSFAKYVNYFYENDKVAGGFAWCMFDYDNEVNYTNTGHVFYSGIYDIWRQDKPVVYMYKSQIDAEDSEPMVYIANNWTKDTTDYVMVMSNCDEVELFVNGVSKGRIKPNTYTSLPHPLYRFNNIAYESGEIKAVGYIDGVAVEETVRETPGEAVRLIAEPDYDTLTADGTDMTSVTITAVDEKGNRVPFASNRVRVEQIEGCDSTMIFEQNAELEGGRIVFLVQSKHGQTGSAKFLVSGDGLESGTCEVAVEPFEADNLVPASTEDGTISQKISSVNDSALGEGQYQFNFKGSWEYGSEKAAYKGDNHWSSTAGDTCEIRFEGKSITYYGAKAPAHGIAAFSIDGGEEMLVDCYAVSRTDDTVLFYSGLLEYGEHVLKVRVTGDKNADAAGIYVNADKVEFNSPMVQVSTNDTDKGTGNYQIEYIGSGWGYTKDNSCYMGDNSWSNTSGDYLIYHFAGDGVRYYATKAPNHGIGAFSLDDGEEERVDFYQTSRESGMILYEASGLEYGEHTLKVRVTGDANTASTDKFVTVDRIEAISTVNAGADSDQLNYLLGQADKIKADGYTEESYQNLQETAAKVRNALTNKELTQSEVDKLTAMLQKALKLKQVPKPLATPTPELTGTPSPEPTKPFATPTPELTGTPSPEPTKPFATPTPELTGTPNPEPTKPLHQSHVGKTFVTGGLKYKVTKDDESSREVRVTSIKTNTKTLKIPAAVTNSEWKETFKITTVKAKAFKGKGITKAVIGKNVTKIGPNAFLNCKKLKSVTIGKSVKTIGIRAFYGCKKLTKITIKSTVLKNVKKNAFRKIPKEAVIKVPKSKKKLYTGKLKGKITSGNKIK